MAEKNLLPSQRNALVGQVDPDLNAVGDHSTEFADMGAFDAMMALIQIGAITGGGTVDVKLEQAQDAAGTGVKDITGKAITQLTAGDEQAIINVRAAELDVDNLFTHVRATMTIGTATADSSVSLLGLDARYGTAEKNSKDLASVVEIIS